MPREVRSSSSPIALVKAALPSAIMRTLPWLFCSFAHAPITKASLTDTHQISSTFFALSLSTLAV